MFNGTFDMNLKFINSDTNKAIKDMVEDQKEEWLRLIRCGYVLIPSTATSDVIYPEMQIYIPSKLYSFSGVEIYQMPQIYITSTTTDTTSYTVTATTSTTNATQYYLFTQNIVGTVQIEGDGCNIPAFEGDVEGMLEIED